MRFDSDKAFLFLKQKGYVATLRDYPYKRYSRIYITRNGKRVAKAVVISVLPNNEKNLEKAVKISGFSTVDEWLEEAKRLNRRIPKYIVIIEIVKWFGEAYS